MSLQHLKIFGLEKLSPFLLGPRKLYKNFNSQNVENAWQYCKVYKDFVDESGKPNEKYFEWALTVWNKNRADRYPMGKGIKPLYSFWNGYELNYIEARKAIYVPLYSEAVVDSQEWQILAHHYINNEDLIIWDFDAYDHHNLNMSLKDVLNCETRTMGHGFVLAMMLEQPGLIMDCLFYKDELK